MQIFATIKYAHIYEMLRMYHIEKYQVSFQTDNDEEFRKMRVIRSDKGLYNASSIYRPLVSTNNYDLLIKAFDIADVRNLSRDILFVGVKAELNIAFYHDLFGTGIRLDGVTIDAYDIYHNAHHWGEAE